MISSSAKSERFQPAKLGTTWLRSLLLSTVFAVLASCSWQTARTEQGWDALPKILENIQAPPFPSRDFDITEFGAVGDSSTDCTEAFKTAIEKCAASGGGRVLVQKGVFLTGAIHLKSSVNLYVAKDATIRFSTEPSKYLPVVYTRWEGVECMNYSPLIYAYEQENIAITGEGILDGRGASETWWSWKGLKEYGWVEGEPSQNAARKRLLEMGEQGVSVHERLFGAGSYLRPNFVQPYKCKNVLIEGVTFRNSPMWFIHPVLSDNVSILNVTVEGLGPNNDGCDPESSKDVLIRNCSFNTGDDCIAIKSGRNADGRRVGVPSENIIVQDCRMKEGHGGVVIGSEMSGGVRNVYAERCTMDSPNLERALRIKTNSVRGGVVENVFMRNVKVGQVADAVVKINFFYEEGDVGRYTPVVRRVEVKNVESSKSKYALWIRAYDRSPATDVHIEDCTFNDVSESNVIERVMNFSLVNVKINGKLVKR
jgi:polygalacturonase